MSEIKIFRRGSDEDHWIDGTVINIPSNGTSLQKMEFIVAVMKYIEQEQVLSRDDMIKSIGIYTKYRKFWQSYGFDV